MPDITLAILAGGEGSRMGQPKGDLRIDDRPILQYLLERFAWTGPTMLVTAPGREHPPAWEMFDSEAVDSARGQGPLRAIMTALEHSTTDVVIAATLDMPQVGQAQLNWLAEQFAIRPAALGMMMRRDVHSREQIEPFPSIFRTAAKAPIAQRLAKGQFSVHGLTEHEAFELVPPCGEWPLETWTNLNRPEDLASFLKRRSSRAGR